MQTQSPGHCYILGQYSVHLLLDHLCTSLVHVSVGRESLTITILYDFAGPPITGPVKSYIETGFALKKKPRWFKKNARLARKRDSPARCARSALIADVRSHTVGMPAFAIARAMANAAGSNK
jgi:hypothetical protein